MQKTLRSGPVATALLASSLVLAPGLTPRAQACGGFWCSVQAPVEQSAEQIIFIDNPDETITTIIQIQYQGPSEKFAWVVPMPGDPKIAVSSNTAFDRLNTATAPQYQLQTEVEGTCMPGQLYYPQAGGFAGSAASAPSVADSASPPPISVVSMGSVGPYDYTTIAVDPQLKDKADAAIQWFKDNGYDLSGVDAEVLGPYLEDGLNLLAFKLTKTAQDMTGTIRPVILTYESKLPMIPIRPTAVAAQNDMGLRVWVSAASQAVPYNYKSLVLNEALINWFGYQSNYTDVVTAAANQAGGQGFVTELAGASDMLEQLIWTASDQTTWEMISNASYPDGIDAIWAANNYYRGWEGWRDAIEAAVELPQGVDINAFASNPDMYRGMAHVDTQEFFTLLKDKVIAPISKTQDLLVSMPYLTRMFSTMSADEMTMDPSFGYNSDLSDVSNMHLAKQYIECSQDVTQYEAPWRIELPQGGVIRGKGGSQWPLALDALPANLKIVQLSSSGPGKVVTDNSSMIGESLFDSSGMVGSGEMIPAKPTQGVMIGGDHTVKVDDTKAPAGNPTAGAADEPGDSSDCAVASIGATPGAASTHFGLLGLGLVAALVIRRRRARS